MGFGRRAMACFVCASALLGAIASSTAGHASVSGPLRGDSLAHQVFSAYTPTDIQSAYNFGPLYERGIDGTGQTVALIEADALSKRDLTSFDETYNLAPPTSLTQYRVGGTSFSLQHDAETTMDVEWLHALAPGAAIQIYYLKNDGSGNQWKQLAAAIRASATHGAKTVSISLGTCASGSGIKVVAKAFAALRVAGVSSFVSSGDDGAFPGPADQCGGNYNLGYPAGDPSVVAVGGTSLHLTDKLSIASESGWKFGGGGNYITRFNALLRASWQKAPTMPNDKYRWGPDVAFVGDPDTGVNVLHNGHWTQSGGTSLGAPAWAAVWALLREDAQNAGVTLHVAPSVMYAVGNSPQYGAAFQDVVTGSNGKYDAGPGWDAVTGWGTPNVSGLASVLETVPSLR